MHLISSLLLHYIRILFFTIVAVTFKLFNFFPVRKSFNVSAVSVANLSSDRETDDVSGSDGDRSAAESVGIVGAGVSEQHNCTQCAGAVTQEVTSLVM